MSTKGDHVHPVIREDQMSTKGDRVHPVIVYAGHDCVCLCR